MFSQSSLIFCSERGVFSLIAKASIPNGHLTLVPKRTFFALNIPESYTRFSSHFKLISSYSDKGLPLSLFHLELVFQFLDFTFGLYIAFLQGRKWSKLSVTDILC